MESKHFNGAMDETLIEFVRSHPLLYKPGHRNYKDNGLKDKVWHEIAGTLGRTVTECKTRWRTIRDSYKKMKNKMESKSLFFFGTYPKSKYNCGCLSFLDETFKERAANSTKYADRIARLNSSQPAAYDDRNSPEPSKRDESRPSIHAQQVKLEIVESDDDDDSSRGNKHSDNDQEIENGARAAFIHHRDSDSALERGSENNVLVTRVELEVEEAGLGTRNKSATDSGDRNSGYVKAEPSCGMVSDSESRAGEKRALTSDSRTAAESGKRRRSVVFGELPACETNSVPAVQSRGNASECPIETFFRSMAASVKSFPPRLIAETRLEICKIVTAAELRFLSEQNEPFASRTNSSRSENTVSADATNALISSSSNS